MKSRRRAVWNWVKRQGLCDLPIDYRKLLQANRVQVIDYVDGREAITKLGLSAMMKHHGFITKADERTYIFFEPGRSKGEENCTILHETGHFAERHTRPGSGAYTEEQEQDAQEYVYELNPTPVLFQAGIQTVDDIQRVTGVDVAAARVILSRIAEYSGRDLTPEERSVCEPFEGFIRRERRRKIRGKLRRMLLPIAVTAVVTAALVSGAYTLWLNGSPKQIPANNLSVVSTPVDAPTSSRPADPARDGATVYWTSGGKVYHVDRGCRYIRDKDDDAVISGSAEESGKSRACKVCGQ